VSPLAVPPEGKPMPGFDPTAYGPVLAALLREAPLNPLDAGRPVEAVRAKLAALGDGAFRPHRVADADAAAACRAGLWLAFNFLDESHAISQGLHTPEGSFWHAILHRREPDASNSKYWWRRVGPHAVIAQITEQAPAVGYGYTTPEAFVDFCERVRGTGTDKERLAQAVQELEWRLLFEHCYRRAVG
jgi:hypothetical protein